MAVCAHDLARGDLFSKRGNREPVAGKLADVSPLWPQMVELEHARVGFAAVHARVRIEMLADEYQRLLAPPLLSGGALPDMELATRPEIGAEAISAPPLVAVAVPVEA